MYLYAVIVKLVVEVVIIAAAVVNADLNWTVVVLYVIVEIVI